MSQVITLEELHGLNEQELRALHGRIINELSRNGRSVSDEPMILVSLRNIEEAIARLVRRRAFKPPGL